MQTIGKAQVIAQAWEDSLLGRIPKDEKDYPEWYKNRLDLCKKCPKNSSNIAFFKKLADMIYGGNLDAKTGLDLLMTAKYFERIGDHAVNIAEWVEYSITGQHRNNEHQDYLNN